MGVLGQIGSAEPEQNAEPVGAASNGFQTTGFYLHAGWEYARPFAVRQWTPEDYRGMFKLLRAMNVDTVMLWPVTENIPSPISPQDEADLRLFSRTMADANATGLACWLATCANLTARPEAAAIPWKHRFLDKLTEPVDLRIPAQRQKFFDHRKAIFSILKNADAYVTIDGDPGGYAKAKPEEFVAIFQADRQAINQMGTKGKKQSVVPWVWCGWGAAGVWNEPLSPLLKPELEAIKAAGPTLEPWMLLPGRSHKEGWANGREVLKMTQQVGLMDRSVLMLYEMVEFEPSCPASKLQFDHIRRILGEESDLAKTARGCMANAQQPVCVLPNIYFYARAAKDLAYLKQTDRQVLMDFAQFLGGDPDVLIPAWSILSLELKDIPQDLPQQLRTLKLGERGTWIPGGAEEYVSILAEESRTRLAVLKAQANQSTNEDEVVALFVDTSATIIRWWNLNRYCQNGTLGEGFRWIYVEPALRKPFGDWTSRHLPVLRSRRGDLEQALLRTGLLPEGSIRQAIDEAIGSS